MGTTVKLALVAALATWTVACGSSSGDGDTMDPVAADPDMGTGGTAAPSDPAGDAVAGAGDNGVAGATPVDDPADDPVEDPTAGDPSEDPADPNDPTSPAAGCDADPHSPACIDTHVRGQCDIDSGFPGDSACLLPPPEGMGIQIHIGPEDYNDPAQVNAFIFESGSESSQCWSLETPNDEDIHYQGWVLSGRDGTHHIINTGYGSPNPASSIGVFTRCRGDTGDTIGRIPGASKPYMPRFAVAPENEGLGYPISAHTAMQSDMHYFNYTDGQILREYWLNLYTVPADQVSEIPNRIRGWGGTSWTFNPIQPGTDMVYNYSCPINADGRITALLGHTHAHAVRFTAWVNRNQLGERLKVFEAFDYLEPQIYAYNTVEENPPFSESSPGAHTGVLEVSAGDTLEWECHVINTSDVGLRFTNYVDTGEMCNIWGESVGPTIDCVL